jgi:sRNA-binding carbon storage regulator CsrA
MIGDGIEVRVLRLGRDGVRLGIVALRRFAFIDRRSTIRSAKRIIRRLPLPPAWRR